MSFVYMSFVCMSFVSMCSYVLWATCPGAMVIRIGAAYNRVSCVYVICEYVLYVLWATYLSRGNDDLVDPHIPHTRSSGWPWGGDTTGWGGCRREID